MNEFNLRKRQRINYNEAEEPGYDDYVFCDACEDYVFEYCSLHGPLLVVPDDKIPIDPQLLRVPRAALTIPHVFLHLAPSIIPGAGLGVFSSRTLPRGVRFGPYSGENTNNTNSTYCWQIFDSHRRPSHVVDAAAPDRSNWMRYVNCSRHWREQNLVAYQYQGELYYRTIRIIPPFEELMVFYGSEFAYFLGVDLKHYNLPTQCLPSLWLNEDNKAEPYAAHGCVTNNSMDGLVRSSPIREENNLTEDKQDNNVTMQINAEITEERHYTVENYYNYDESTRGDINLREVKQDTMQINSKTNEEMTTYTNEVDTTVICNECNVNFQSKSSLIEHLEIHTKDNLIFNPTPDENPVLQKDPTYEKYLCPMCNYQNADKYKVKRHWYRHIGKKFSCVMCHTKLSSKSCLTRHIKSFHKDYLTNSCTFCSTTFSERYNLDSHLIICDKKSEQTTTGYMQQQYMCKICKKIISGHGNFNSHVRAHYKPTSALPCEICNKNFRTNYTLKRHLKIHTEIKKYRCPKCPRVFLEMDSVKRHLASHERGAILFCSLCPSIFKTQENLNVHLHIHN